MSCISRCSPSRRSLLSLLSSRALGETSTAATTGLCEAFACPRRAAVGGGGELTSAPRGGAAAGGGGAAGARGGGELLRLTERIARPCAAGAASISHSGRGR